MRAEPIDPRDQTSEHTAPAYRVLFWSEDGAACEEWELTEADLDEVLAWIPERSDGRSHSLWAVAREAGDVCLVRLRGVDESAPADVWPQWARREYR